MRTNTAEQIWNIFLGLTDYLKKLDKRENGSKDWDHYKFKRPEAYRLINLEPEYSHENEKADNVFKVMPLVDGEKVPSMNPSFEQYAAPKGKFNAFAMIGIGHRFDEYDSGDRSDGGEEPRLKVAKDKVFPKFVSDLNAFLWTQKIDGKPLKAEIVNGKFNTLSGPNAIYPYKRFWGNSMPDYYQYVMPLALRISFA